jgi:DNA-binding Lrp family transcriptional regulator
LKCNYGLFLASGRLRVVCAMLAYVLVKIHPGKESVVASEVGKIKEIAEAAWTYGFCDMMLHVKAESTQELEEVVLNRIRKISGVQSTQTIAESPIPIYASRTTADSFRKKQLSEVSEELLAAAQ